MNDDVITDLKQFITATFSQRFTEFDNKISVLGDEINGLRSEMRNEFADVRSEMRSGFATIIDIIDTSNDTNGDQLKNHERRINSLEKKISS